MKITKVHGHLLDNIPIESPPFRDEPSIGKALVIEVETDDGHVGWAQCGTAHPLFADFVNTQLAPSLEGENPFVTERIWHKVGDARPEGKFGLRRLGPVLTLTMSAVDIALWDIKAQAVGIPLHHLVGGASDKVAVYVTHGAAYGKAPVYTPEELAEEAKHLVSLGNNHLKNTVGRQLHENEFAPDPDDDLVRMTAIREAVGPDVKLAMDANSRMSRAAAIRLCKLVEDLRISFFEEPVVDNVPGDLAAIRRQTSVPIASAENHRYGASDFIAADAVDYLQPNVTKDGGFTGALRLANTARAFNIPLGHGNGGGMHNLAFHAGIANGQLVEYHYHHWMTWNALYDGIPQPQQGYAHLSTAPGSGITPKDGALQEYATQ